MKFSNGEKKSNPPTLQVQFFVLVTATLCALGTIHTMVTNTYYSFFYLKIQQNTNKATHFNCTYNSPINTANIAEIRVSQSASE